VGPILLAGNPAEVQADDAAAVDSQIDRGRPGIAGERRCVVAEDPCLLVTGKLARGRVDASGRKLLRADRS
jgi:hypothetical protein